MARSTSLETFLFEHQHDTTRHDTGFATYRQYGYEVTQVLGVQPSLRDTP